MLTDLKYAVRMLWKSPGFTIIAILTLALGIGANSAIFSVIDSVLLRPLPFHKADRLIDIFSLDPNGERDSLSVPELQALQTQMRSAEEIAGFQSQSVNVTGGERPDRVRGGFISTNFFRAFNVSTLVGRTFVEGEDRPGAPRVVVVNEKFWHERLGSDARLEKPLILNGESYSVIGVISSEFKPPFDPEIEVWMSTANYSGNTGQQDSRFMIPLGHLKAGVSIAQAQAEANTIAAQWAAAYPKENAGRGIKVDLYQDFVVRNVRAMLWLLLLAAGVILLIACANLANLLLARGLSRHREIALRAALGANRLQLVRQLLIESGLLALLGGVAGVLVAHWAVWALLKLPQNFVEQQNPTVDATVILFALGVSIVVAILFGLVPALHLSRVELHSALKEGEHSTLESARWNRIRGGSVILQIALSILLLAGSGLLIRSFDKLLRADVGFDTRSLLTLEYRLPRVKYGEPDRQWDFHRQVVQQVGQLPGIKSVALIRSLPFSGNGGSAPIGLLDRENPTAGHEPHVSYNVATSGLFQTLRIPLLRGRVFNDDDRLTAPRVFVINQTMARKFWPDQDPIGKQIRLLEDGTTGTIVGVVGDTKFYLLTDEAVPQLYSSYAQQSVLFATLVARTGVEPLSLAETVRQSIWRVDPDQPMWKIRTIEFLIQRSVADRKFTLALMIVFAALALTLATIGLYGVITYLVNRRTREIGIRMALGAQVRDVITMILRQGLTFALIGTGLGILVAVLLTRLMSHLLFGISPTDPFTYIAIVLLLAIVAVIACYLPARRAALVDPVQALRSE